jgi:hypothetical protein
MDRDQEHVTKNNPQAGGPQSTEDEALRHELKKRLETLDAQLAPVQIEVTLIAREDEEPSASKESAGTQGQTSPFGEWHYWVVTVEVEDRDDLLVYVRKANLPNNVLPPVSAPRNGVPSGPSADGRPLPHKTAPTAAEKFVANLAKDDLLRSVGNAGGHIQRVSGFADAKDAKSKRTAIAVFADGLDKVPSLVADVATIMASAFVSPFIGAVAGRLVAKTALSSLHLHRIAQLCRAADYLLHNSKNTEKSWDSLKKDAASHIINNEGDLYGPGKDWSTDADLDPLPTPRPSGGLEDFDGQSPGGPDSTGPTISF